MHQLLEQAQLDLSAATMHRCYCWSMGPWPWSKQAQLSNFYLVGVMLAAAEGARPRSSGLGLWPSPGQSTGSSTYNPSGSIIVSNSGSNSAVTNSDTTKCYTLVLPAPRCMDH